MVSPISQRRSCVPARPRPPPPGRQLVGAPGGGSANKVCGVVEEVARAALGDGPGPLAGDVLGATLLAKLSDYSSGAARGSKRWPLPAGTKVPPLVQACRPLSGLFPEYSPSQGGGGGAAGAAAAPQPAAPLPLAGAPQAGRRRRLLAAHN